MDKFNNDEFNYDDEFNDNETIRQPDEVRREQLIEDNRDDFQKQIDEAIYISLQEIKKQQEINIKYEEKLMSDYLKENNKRKEIFHEFLFNLMRVSKFDKNIREIYDIIEPIIDSYCNQLIHVCQLDDVTHDKIFNTLQKIRINKESLEFLKTIIVKEHI